MIRPTGSTIDGRVRKGGRGLPVSVSQLLLAILVCPAAAQSIAPAAEDPLQDLNRKVRDALNNTFGFTFEERTRWEQKQGVNFGRSVNQQDMLSRLRIGAEYRPVSWLRFSAIGQDAR